MRHIVFLALLIVGCTTQGSKKQSDDSNRLTLESKLVKISDSLKASLKGDNAVTRQEMDVQFRAIVKNRFWDLGITDSLELGLVSTYFDYNKDSTKKVLKTSAHFRYWNNPVYFDLICRDIDSEVVKTLSEKKFYKVSGKLLGFYEDDGLNLYWKDFTDYTMVYTNEVGISSTDQFSKEIKLGVIFIDSAKIVQLN